MAVLKCKMCGGNIEVSGDARVIECEYCGTNQTIPDGSDEKKVNLFNRANRLRMDCEFDKAAGVYESIVSEYPEESEGYWGLVLCRFGIEYVDDAATGKKIPTCHRTNTTSIMDDADFEQVLENSDVIAKGTYREEAKAIDRLQRKIISVAESEEPYDVFICYKETDDITKQRTEDSSIAQDIYTELVREGYKVFFSRITLRDKAGTEYEPYIYAALSSAKVMLAIGTKYDYYDAVWVKNEWGRFISMMKNDNTKHLIPCFKNLDAYDIPKEFKNLQALDMGEMMFFKNLMENVGRFIPKTKAEVITETIKESVVVQNQTVSQTEPLLKRVFMFLEDGNWESADEYCEKVLDLDPECAKAYLGKLMAELQVKKEDDLGKRDKPFVEMLNYQKAIRFADTQLKDKLERYSQMVQEQEIVGKYERAKKIFDSCKSIEDYKNTERLFEAISSWQDSIELANKCREKISELELLQKTHFEKIKEAVRDYNIKTCRPTIAIGYLYTVGLCSDGTVVISDNDTIPDSNPEIWNNLSKWYDVVAVTTDGECVFGLCSNGTVVTCGKKEYGWRNTSTWRGIVEICVADRHAVGLRASGTVVAIGDNTYKQCNVSNWRDIVKIAVGYMHTVGLCSNGTVVACGYNADGQCEVSNWHDIIAISAGYNYTVAISSDGTVVACGDNEEGQCNVSEWRDIIAIAVGGGHTVGLRLDGTVVACGDNEEGQCNVSEWCDVIAIAVGGSHTVGLRSDGTVVACGDNEEGQCNVSEWRDVVAIAANTDNTLALCSDGTIIGCGEAEDVPYHKYDWHDIALPPKQKNIKELLAFEKERSKERSVKLMNELTAEKESLTKELPTLGFFAVGRKKEINNRLAEIEQILQNLK